MPTRIRRDGEDQFEGAYVMEPRVNGIEKNVHVGDFKSLYPSIIMSWNLGPDTKDPAGTCTSPSTGMTSTVERDGFFPMALARLLDLRKLWAKKKDTLPKGTPEWHAAMQKSTAYKVAANSFYGVLGSSYSRFFDKLVATSVTQNGKWLILKTIEAAESHGWRVIYADTDSVFVVGPTKEQFESFVAWCNAEYYPKLLSECGCKKNYICLNFEKTLERIVFPRSSTGEYAAKRYAAKYDGSAADAKPEIKGLEYKRGDSLKLARSFQWEIIQVLMSGCEDPDVYEKMVQDKLRHVFYGDIDLADIVQTKSISQPLEAYKAKSATHIRIAEEMKEAGEDIRPGVRVEYVVVDGDQSPVVAVPASEYAGEFDRRWVWNKHVYPPTMRLLAGAFPGRNWARWLIKKTRRISKSQTSLF
jgi:DNA polymerase elongation subunit (family B)